MVMRRNLCLTMIASLTISGCVDDTRQSLKQQNLQYDVVSQPRTVLSKTDTERLWSAYRTAETCMDHTVYGAGQGFSIETKSSISFENSPWHNPFFREEALAGSAKISGRNPNPIIIVDLVEAYGERLGAVDYARQWFTNANQLMLRETNIQSREQVKQVLLDWASQDALSKGIHVSWGTKPVDWQIMSLISSILVSASIIGPDLTPNERVLIGQWLNPLVRDVAKSSWRHRQDNKAYMAAYITLVWGYMTSDHQAIQSAINVYKTAINDMRPDGSFPIDSQRGGMGLKYNADALGYLVMIAALVKKNSNQDLYDFSVDGRSIHNAVAFVANGIKNPSETNQIYAISCPDSGDRWGSISQPSLYFKEASTYLSVYAWHNPNEEISGFIRNYYGNNKTPSEVFGAAPVYLIR